MAGVIGPDLDLVVTLLQSRHDANALATPAAAVEWLASRGLMAEDSSLERDDLRQLWRLRAALNALIADRETIEARTRNTIEAATTAAPMRLALDADGELTLTSAGTPMESALAGIVAAFYRCQLRGEVERLKACRGCGYAFVDVSKNQSRVWCDMALCGSQTKARAYRQRKAGEARLESAAVSTNPTAQH